MVLCGIKKALLLVWTILVKRGNPSKLQRLRSNDKEKPELQLKRITDGK